jgi:membrane-associated phospholipid phosphatase
MRPAKQWIEARLLPRGWGDLIRQGAMFVVAFVLYDLVREAVAHGNRYKPFGDATKIIDFERGLHLFVEPSIQAWAANVHWLMDVLVWTYLNTQFVITVAGMAFIYVRRNDSFHVVRNMFLIAMGLALIGYWLFPTAPPRLMPEWGFTDPVSQMLTGGTSSIDYTRAASVTNMYAAVPSMHVCFAAMVAGSMARLMTRRRAKLGCALYPLLVTFVVVATANHYFVDVALGFVTAGVAAVLAQRLPRENWVFRPRERVASTPWPTTPTS